MRRPLVVSALLAGLAGTAHAGTYELKDLEALEKQEAWQEAVEHLGDVLPTKRNDVWQRIAERAAAGWLGQLEGPKTLAAADDLGKRYPILKKSKAYMQGRADAGLKAFAKTYGDSRHSAYDDPWLEHLKAFVEEDSLTADLPMKAGKLVAKRLVAVTAFPLFKKALNAAGGAAACKDPDVKKSVAEALVQGTWLEDAKVQADKCFADVRPLIEAELAKEENDKAITNACPLFKAKKVTNAACK